MPLASEEIKEERSELVDSPMPDIDVQSNNSADASGDSQSTSSESSSSSSSRASSPSFTAESAKLLSSPSERTVIIFDWDDTLLASSFLSSKGYRLDTPSTFCEEVDMQLKLLEKSVAQVIATALKYGEVHVITNAESGWVELSAQKFMPGVVPLLSQVSVLSARSTYEESFPAAPLKWKYMAFQERLSSSFQDKTVFKNIMSFGDSHVEREAVRMVTRGMPKAKTKSIKFAERPSMEQLRRQIDLVLSCFHCLLAHDGDLDLMLTMSMMNTSQAAEASGKEEHSVQTSLA